MNKYLQRTQYYDYPSMVKQAKESNNDLRDTGIIGAVGTASSLITNNIQDRMGLNGAKAKPNLKAPSVSLLDRVKSTIKSPIKTMSKTFSTPGFRRAAKIGAIGGAVGLAGDYAAVKLNKKLEKSAEEISNIYLDKIQNIVNSY